MDKGPHTATPRGRPKLSSERAKRHPLNIRTTKTLKDLLRDAADSSGRSAAQEIELRLERSFRDEDRADAFRAAIYGPQLAGLLELIGRAARAAVGPHLESDWLSDDNLRRRAGGAIREILAALSLAAPRSRPAGDELVGAEVARVYLEGVAAPPGAAPPTTVLSDGSLPQIGRAIRSKLGAPAAGLIGARLSRPLVGRGA